MQLQAHHHHHQAWRRPPAPAVGGAATWHAAQRRHHPAARCSSSSSSSRSSSSSTSNGSSSSSTQENLAAACYEEVVEALAARAVAAAATLPPNRVHLVGIAGAPGSGKSTLAKLVARHINGSAGAPAASAAPHQHCAAAVVPMDGFHLYKAQLDAMPDPQEAHARRGAPWTFDAEAFVAAVRRISEAGAAVLPSFDHGVGDPKAGDIRIDSSTHRIVLVEGNYLFLPHEPWVQLRPLFADTWFCDVDVDTAMHRVFERQTAIGVTPERSRVRIATNDRPNAELVNASKGVAKVLVPSNTPFNGGSGPVAQQQQWRPGGSGDRTAPM